MGNSRDRERKKQSLAGGRSSEILSSQWVSFLSAVSANSKFLKD